MKHLAGSGALLIALSLSFACGSVQTGADAGDNPDAANVVDAAGNPADATPAAPTLTLVEPDWGSMAGGTAVTITGSNFTRAGAVSVTFGGNAATDVVVVSDTQITATTPAGPHAAVGVSVTTDGGTGDWSSNYRYLAPLYAAPSMGHMVGDLYTVDPTSGASTSVGSLGMQMTGIAISPAGIMYGISGDTACCNTAATLVTIDPYTAAVTPVATITDGATGNFGRVADITFEGSRLVGWSEAWFDGVTSFYDNPVEIDTTTAVGTVLNGTSTNSSGTGFAGRGTGTVYANFAVGTLYTFDAATFTATVGATLSPNPGSVNGLTFVGSELYGCRKGGAIIIAGGSTGGPSELIKIDPSTGAVTDIGALPDNTDALAGIPDFASAAQVPAAPRAQPVAPRAAALPAPPPPATLTVTRGQRTVLRTTVADLGALSGAATVRTGGRERILVPLAGFATTGVRAIEIEVEGGATGRWTLAEVRAQGLQLTRNQRGQFKLLDADGHKRASGLVAIHLID